MSNKAPDLTLRCMECGFEGHTEDIPFVQVTESQGRYECPDCEKTKFCGVSQ
jgi:predicted RNA-binding Zn-ribbon protein involved in translation (DUF1610 family)